MGRVDDYIQETLLRENIPGLSVAVMRVGEPLLLCGYGLANVEHSVPAMAQTVYEIASVGKTFTAFVVMMLVEEGAIDLEGAIADYIEDLPEAWRSVKVRHILSHQSGLPNYTKVDNYWTEVCWAQLSRTEVVDLVRDQPLLFEPGTYSSYDNTGYFLLGIMLEKVAGCAYGELMRSRLFEPLGMSATRLNNYDEIVPHRASGYRWVDGKLVNKPYYSSSVTFSGGGHLSSIEDMVKYEQELLNPTLLKQSTLELMWTYQPPSSGETWEAENYAAHLRAGLGWLMPDYAGKHVVGHNGSIVGFASNITRFIDEGITVVLFCNLDKVVRPDALAKEIVGYYSTAIADVSIQPPL